MADTRTKMEINTGSDADCAAGRATPPDVVGDWLSSLAKDQTALAQLLIANIRVPRRILP
jgi:hypothetical protein